MKNRTRIVFLSLMLLSILSVEVSAQKNKKQQNRAETFFMNVIAAINEHPTKPDGVEFAAVPVEYNYGNLSYLAKNTNPTDIHLIDVEEMGATLPGIGKLIIWDRGFKIPNEERSPIDLLKVGKESDGFMNHGGSFLTFAKAVGIDPDDLDRFSVLPIILIDGAFQLVVTENDLANH
ncbi:MAG: hypothetical protein AAF598_21995 [Bacteroidota bacterium]